MTFCALRALLVVKGGMAVMAVMAEPALWAVLEPQATAVTAEPEPAGPPMAEPEATAEPAGRPMTAALAEPAERAVWDVADKT